MWQWFPDLFVVFVDSDSAFVFLLVVYQLPVRMTFWNPRVIWYCQCWPSLGNPSLLCSVGSAHFLFVPALIYCFFFLLFFGVIHAAASTIARSSSAVTSNTFSSNSISILGRFGPRVLLVTMLLSSNDVDVILLVISSE